MFTHSDYASYVWVRCIGYLRTLAVASFAAFGLAWLQPLSIQVQFVTHLAVAVTILSVFPLVGVGMRLINRRSARR